MKSTSGLLRRDVLKTGGAFLVSFLFNPAPREASAQTGSGPVHAGKTVDIHQVDSFLEIHRDGSVTIYTGKVDLGTGLRIAVRQMAAEELGIPIARVDLVEGDTGLTPDQGRTGGSSGLVQGGVGVRQAAATARTRIFELASQKLDRPVSSLSLSNGQVTSSVGGPAVAISDLVGDKPFELKVDPKVALKDPRTYSVVGQSIPRPDVPGKCTGKHTYVHDFKVPGMLHGRVIRPPALGAKLVSVDESSVAGIPDVRVVRMNDFLGVVAKNEWAAIRAAATLKATWSDWQGLPTDAELPRVVRESVIDHDEKPVSRGDSRSALAASSAPSASSAKFSASYYFPYQGHASMGPSCAVADVRPDSITIWTASQSTHLFRTIFAESFGLPESKVRLIYLDGSGCYGQNAHEDAAADAAVLSRAVGSPVRVQWMRQDEHGWDPKGPPEVIDMRAIASPDGTLTAWETELWVPMWINTKGTIPLVGLDAAGIKQRQGRWPGSVDENLDPPYSTPNVTVTVHRLKDSPLRTGHVRAPGKVASVWAVESLADEIAVASKMDAVA
ncbi:MAG TPA: molybdopterin cofactor-binding domain-containing protein, partial [Bryobacteraceae bacterium]|nr:molybdopterin cofactor-binding domain-containing protein [Bryobacteraceae bacterium]